MSRIDKLIDQIKKRPVEAEYSDVDRLLRHFGWILDHQKGSHVSYFKKGEQPIAFPKRHGRKVKQVYLDDICSRLGLDD